MIDALDVGVAFAGATDAENNKLSEADGEIVALWDPDPETDTECETVTDVVGETESANDRVESRDGEVFRLPVEDALDEDVTEGLVDVLRENDDDGERLCETLAVGDVVERREAEGHTVEVNESDTDGETERVRESEFEIEPDCVCVREAVRQDDAVSVVLSRREAVTEYVELLFIVGVCSGDREDELEAE
jgi:hypothetical protein